MKRSQQVSVSLSVFALALVFVVMTVPVAAQRPGRATPIATVDRSSMNAKRTPIATPNAAQPTHQRPTPAATFSIPLNFTLTPHSTLSVPGSSEEATTVMNSFASTHLGISYDFLYAGSLSGSNSSANWNAVFAQLPATVQSYITAFSSASAGSYWGLFKSGMGMTAIGDCTNNPNCTISIDSLNMYLTSASSGVYSVYMAGTANNASDALNLIYSAYPNLSSVALQAITTDQGYTFQAVDYGTGVSNQQVTASTRIYVAGVVQAGTQSLVYVAVGVGDGYVGVIQ